MELMNKDYLKALLKKFRSGKISSEEKKLLISYYELFEAQPDMVVTLSDDEKAELKGELESTVWGNILADKRHSTPVRFINRGWVRAAAAVIVVVFSVSMFYFLNQSENKNTAPIASVRQPTAENRVIFLPDGSKVILKGDSKLNYPSTFEGMNKREVFLSGEAYFDIAHNEKMPFIVKTGKIETVVLGTAFNVKAYAGQQTITVTVTRGKVKVVDGAKSETLGVITPNQQIVYNTANAVSSQETVDAMSVIDWEKQDLICDNVTLAEAVQLLEDRFHISAIIEDPAIRSQRFTTTFARDENLENVLKSICVFNGLTYEFTGSDTVRIAKKK